MWTQHFLFWKCTLELCACCWLLTDSRAKQSLGEHEHLFSSQKNLERYYCKHDSGLSVHPCWSCCLLCVYVMLILYTHTQNQSPLMKEILHWESFLCPCAHSFLCGAPVRTMQSHNGTTERCGNRVKSRGPLVHVTRQKITATGLCCDWSALPDTTLWIFVAFAPKRFEK